MTAAHPLDRQPLASRQRTLESIVFEELDHALKVAADFFLRPGSPDSVRIQYRRTPVSIATIRLNKPDSAR
jgi:hypothetical protein